MGSAGSVFYFKTDLDAPRRRLVAIDLETLEPKTWKEIIPQAEPTLMQVSFVGDRFIALYLEDVKPKARVFDRDGKHVRDTAPGLTTSVEPSRLLEKTWLCP